MGRLADERLMALEDQQENGNTQVGQNTVDVPGLIRGADAAAGRSFNNAADKITGGIGKMFNGPQMDPSQMVAPEGYPRDRESAVAQQNVPVKKVQQKGKSTAPTFEPEIPQIDPSQVGDINIVDTIRGVDAAAGKSFNKFADNVTSGIRSAFTGTAQPMQPAENYQPIGQQSSPQVVNPPTPATKPIADNTPNTVVGTPPELRQFFAPGETLNQSQIAKIQQALKNQQQPAVPKVAGDPVIDMNVPGSGYGMNSRGEKMFFSGNKMVGMRDAQGNSINHFSEPVQNQAPAPTAPAKNYEVSDGGKTITAGGLSMTKPDGWTQDEARQFIDTQTNPNAFRGYKTGQLDTVPNALAISNANADRVLASGPQQPGLSRNFLTSKEYGKQVMETARHDAANANALSIAQLNANRQGKSDDARIQVDRERLQQESPMHQAQARHFTAQADASNMDLATKQKVDALNTQYQNAQTEEERRRIANNIAVLTGKQQPKFQIAQDDDMVDDGSGMLRPVKRSFLVDPENGQTTRVGGQGGQPDIAQTVLAKINANPTYKKWYEAADPRQREDMLKQYIARERKLSAAR